MSGNPPRTTNPNKALLDVASMSTERPLDALLPALQQARRAPVPRTPVHQRVLEVAVEGGFEWNIAVFSDPGSVRELHKQVLALLEATLLAELSGSPKRTHERGTVRKPRAVRLTVFPTLPYDVAPALVAFAMRPLVAELDDARMAVWRSEARDVGVTLPAKPASVWVVEVAHATGLLGEKLDRIELGVAKLLGDDVWGATPGVPSHAWATWAREEFQATVKPDSDGLRSFELLAVQQAPGVIRWMGPLAFQALCDLIGVVAQAEYKAPVSWAVCTEEKSGLAPPPVFRVEPRSGPRYHVPIAHHVLRWSMMPLQPGEQVPSLADWMPDQFGG